MRAGNVIPPAPHKSQVPLVGGQTPGVGGGGRGAVWGAGGRGGGGLERGKGHRGLDLIIGQGTPVVGVIIFYEGLVITYGEGERGGGLQNVKIVDSKVLAPPPPLCIRQDKNICARMLKQPQNFLCPTPLQHG